MVPHFELARGLSSMGGKFTRTSRIAGRKTGGSSAVNATQLTRQQVARLNVLLVFGSRKNLINLGTNGIRKKIINLGTDGITAKKL